MESEIQRLKHELQQVKSELASLKNKTSAAKGRVLPESFWDNVAAKLTADPDSVVQMLLIKLSDQTRTSVNPEVGVIQIVLHVS